MELKKWTTFARVLVDLRERRATPILTNEYGFIIISTLYGCPRDRLMGSLQILGPRCDLGANPGRDTLRA